MYSPKIIKAILKAAETKWINVAEAHAIAKSLQPSKTLEAILAQPFNEAIEKSKAEQAAADKAEAEAILDGTPPELPASEATLHNVFLPSFDRAAETMLLMRTKPLDSFFGTALGPDRFRDIVAFLQAFITAFERRNEGNAEAVARKGAAR